jgi:hypothetical protein
VYFANIKQLAWHAVRLAGIKDERAFVTDYFLIREARSRIEMSSPVPIFLTHAICAFQMTLSCITKFSRRKSAGYVELALMPPTRAAAAITYSGFSDA